MSMAKLAKLGVARELQESNHPDDRPGTDVTNNSYGVDGYGWMPYEYARRGVADDWWVMTSADWINPAAFDA